MLVKAWVVAAVGLLPLCAGGVGAAQKNDPLKPLRHGQIVVWVVKAPPAKGPVWPYTTPVQLPTEHQERSVGNFGTAASDYGTASSDVGVATTSVTISRTGRVGMDVGSGDATDIAAASAGYKQQTAGSFGKPAGAYGQAASDRGQNASTLGQAASTFGTASSDTGQTAGSFGHSLSTIAGAGQAAQMPAPRLSTREQAGVDDVLKDKFPGLVVVLTELSMEEVSEEFKSDDGTLAQPDVVVFEGFASRWEGPPVSLKQMAVASVGLGSSAQAGADGRRWLVLQKPQHPEVARALVVYLDGVATYERAGR